MSYNKYSKPDFPSSELSPTDITRQFVPIYEKLQNQNTKEVSYDLFKRLIETCLYNESNMLYIIQSISDNVNSPNNNDRYRDSVLKLLSLIFFPSNNSDKSQNLLLYNKYISRVLSIFQALINDNYSTHFQTIANTYSEIVENVLPTSIESSANELDVNMKRMFEMLQGFCFYNMNQEQKSNRLVGSLCLTKLVENCPIVLNSNYMKIIWENLMHFLEKPNYNSKTELLNCLISLILGAETDFKPYANVTLYKIIEFLTDNDWVKRKLALNVIYTIVHYCKDEVISLKSNLIEFLKLLKVDKVKEVRDICILILDVLNSNEDDQGNMDNVEGNNNKGKSFSKREKDKGNSSYNRNNNNKLNHQSIDYHNNNDNSYNNISNNNINYDDNDNPSTSANVSNSNNNFNSRSNNRGQKQEVKNSHSINKKKQQESKTSLTSANNNRKSRENFKKPNKDFVLVTKKGENVIPSNPNPIDISNNFVQKSVESSSKRSITPNRYTKKNKGLTVANTNANLNNSNDDIDTGNQLTSNNNNNNKNVISSQNLNLVSRKEDGTFVNEKMVIRHDPNKSAFKNAPNSAFFQNKNKGGFVLVLDKKNDGRGMGNYEDGNNNINNNLNNNINNNINNNNVGDNKGEMKNDLELIEDKIKNGSVSGSNSNSNNLSKRLNSNITDNNNIKLSIDDNNQQPNQNSIPKINDYKTYSKTPKNLPNSNTNNQNSVNNINNNSLNNIKDLKSSSHTKALPPSNRNIPQFQKNQPTSNNAQPPIPPSSIQSNINPSSSPNNTSNSIPPNIINLLLSQMNSLSNKQLTLLNSLESIKNNTNNELIQLNSKINSLQGILNNLKNELVSLKSNSNSLNKMDINNYQDINMNKENDIMNNMNDIFKNSLNDDKKLVEVISKASLDDLGDIDIIYLEKAIVRLISMLSKGQNIKSIISFYKSIILCLKMPLKNDTINSIVDILNYIIENNEYNYHLDNNTFLDISILIKSLQDYKHEE